MFARCQEALSVSSLSCAAQINVGNHRLPNYNSFYDRAYLFTFFIKGRRRRRLEEGQEVLWTAYKSFVLKMRRVAALAQSAVLALTH